MGCIKPYKIVRLCYENQWKNGQVYYIVGLTVPVARSFLIWYSQADFNSGDIHPVTGTPEW